MVKVLDRCHGFDFSPDSRQLAVLSRSKCVVYDLKDWTKERQIKPLGEAIERRLFRGRLVAHRHRARRGQIPAAQRGRLSPAKQRLNRCRSISRSIAIAVSADGSLLATGHDGGNVVLWDSQTLDVKSRLQTGVRGLAHPFFSPDARMLAAGCQETGDVVMWNLADRQEIGPLHVRKRRTAYYYNRPASATASPRARSDAVLLFARRRIVSRRLLRRHSARHQRRPGVGAVWRVISPSNAM